MFARVTLLEIDTVRISVDDALAVFKEAVMPGLHEQPGFLGVNGFATPEGKAMLISYWETAEQAAPAGDETWYTGVLEEYMTLFRSPPGREQYEVLLAEWPDQATGEPAAAADPTS